MVATLSFINMPDSSCPSLSANLTAAPPAPAAHDAAVGHGSIWTYSGETGPENWAKLSDDFKACGEGKRQSPINVKRVDAKSDVKLDLKLSMFSDMGQLLDNDFKNLVSATNNGHAVGVADASGFFTYQNVDYKLLQFNFHTPSEHRLDEGSGAVKERPGQHDEIDESGADLDLRGEEAVHILHDLRSRQTEKKNMHEKIQVFTSFEKT